MSGESSSACQFQQFRLGELASLAWVRAAFELKIEIKIKILHTKTNHWKNKKLHSCCRNLISNCCNYLGVQTKTCSSSWFYDGLRVLYSRIQANQSIFNFLPFFKLGRYKKKQWKQKGYTQNTFDLLHFTKINFLNLKTVKYLQF